MSKQKKTARGNRARVNKPKPKNIDDVIVAVLHFEIPGHVVEAIGWSKKTGVLTHARQLGAGEIETREIGIQESVQWLGDMLQARYRFGLKETRTEDGLKNWVHELAWELSDLHSRVAYDKTYKVRQPCNRGFIPGWQEKHWGKWMRKKKR